MSELEFDLLMVEKLGEHKPTLNLPIPTCIKAIKIELAFIVKAREDIFKELDDMKQSIV
jgi:hypothetical protein